MKSSVPHLQQSWSCRGREQSFAHSGRFDSGWIWNLRLDRRLVWRNFKEKGELTPDGVCLFLAEAEGIAVEKVELQGGGVSRNPAGGFSLDEDGSTLSAGVFVTTLLHA